MSAHISKFNMEPRFTATRTGVLASWEVRFEPARSKGFSSEHQRCSLRPVRALARAASRTKEELVCPTFRNENLEVQILGA